MVCKIAPSFFGKDGEQSTLGSGYLCPRNNQSSRYVYLEGSRDCTYSYSEMEKEFVFYVFMMTLFCPSYLDCQSDELPPDVDPIEFMKLITSDLKQFCPSGIDRCECANSPGNFSTGPFFYEEDPLGVLITYLGCTPGTANEHYTFTHKSMRATFQVSASAGMIPRKRWTLGKSETCT